MLLSRAFFLKNPHSNYSYSFIETIIIPLVHGIAYSAQERDNYVNDAIGVADELIQKIMVCK